MEAQRSHATMDATPQLRTEKPWIEIEQTIEKRTTLFEGHSQGDDFFFARFLNESFYSTGILVRAG